MRTKKSPLTTAVAIRARLMDRGYQVLITSPSRLVIGPMTGPKDFYPYTIDLATALLAELQGGCHE
jgi:hypothetical protein